MAAYYNEIDKYAAAWLRELIKEGLIADGEVDERSIADVTADDVRGFVQCHFFAGIGGWSLALRLAGWADDRAVWTGSCPCQPFSQTGRGAGFADERHLWPAWFWLIEQCGPVVVLGEQVDSPHARGWLDLVSTDMEGAGYAFAPAVLPAASVGAPHGRHRLWFVGHADLERCVAVGMGDADGVRCGWRGEGEGRQARRSTPRTVERVVWSESEAVLCADGKRRAIEPGTFPLVTRLPTHVEQIRAYGNSIVPQVAAAFIEAYMSVLEVA